MYSFRWILAVYHRAGFHTSIVMLWEKQLSHELAQKTAKRAHPRALAECKNLRKTFQNLSCGNKRLPKDSIPAGCVLPTVPPTVCALVATTRFHYQWRWVSPKMNKFEQVPSDDHKTSVAGEGGRVSRSHIWGEGSRVSRSHVHVGEWYPTMWSDLSNNLDTLPSLRQTHACENITLPKLCLRAVMNRKLQKTKIGLLFTCFAIS